MKCNPAIDRKDLAGYEVSVFAHQKQTRSDKVTGSFLALDSLHLHDTCGLGIANAVAGLEEGIHAFDSCLAGLGGCPYAPGASGNVVTEDLVFMLESMGFETGIDLAKLVAARALLEQGLPSEPRHGGVARAGIPRTFKAAA